MNLYPTFAQQYASVSWREVFRHGPFVFMRRGTGETGWWHQHDDEDDCGGNPMDFKKDEAAVVCRSCGKGLATAETKRLRDAMGGGDGMCGVHDLPIPCTVCEVLKDYLIAEASEDTRKEASREKA